MRPLSPGVLIVVLGLGCTPAAPPPPAPSPPLQRGAVVRVAVVVGGVTRQIADGKPIALHHGEVLGAADIIRTGDGTATLEIGGVADVEIAAHTEASIGELSDTLAKVHLTDGRIAAVVHGGDHNTLQIDSLGAVAHTSLGEFSMLSGGSQVSVAAVRGQVTLSAKGRSVRIGSGQLSVVTRDQAPTPPAAIPPSLFLKLGATRPTTQSERQAVLRGTTAPGAVISINGVRVNADAHGEFTATMPLKAGPNRLTVDSADTIGRHAHAEWPRITVEERAAQVHSKVRW